MYKVNRPLEYNRENSPWKFTFSKSFKDVHSQGGLKKYIEKL